MRGRTLFVIIISFLATGLSVWSADGPLYRLIDTQPSMAWALSVRPESDGFTVQLNLPAPDLVTGEAGVEVRPGGPSAWPDPGQPQLPVFPVLIELADGLTYELAAEPGGVEEIPVGPIRAVTRYQAAGSVDQLYDVQELTERDPAIYTTDAFWPDAWVETREAKGMGRRYLRIAVMPYRYHALQGLLHHAPALSVRVRLQMPAAEEIP
jgi:hypothetical protein